MKFDNVIKKMSHFGCLVDAKGAYHFWTRNEALKNRIVKVVNQDGRAIALPMYVDKDGIETVVFHATTIKSLVNFLKGE